MYNNSNFRKHKQAYELAKDAGGGGGGIEGPYFNSPRIEVQ